MQSQGDQNEKEESSTQNETDTHLQAGSDTAVTASPAPQESQGQSLLQSDDPILHPYPDLNIGDENPPEATDSVQDDDDQVTHLFNISEDMEDPEPLPEENEEELLVLDFEHPQVKRQQAALSIQLKNQLERINQKLKEKLAIEKEDARHLEEVSVETFQMQEHLARLQKKLDDHHETKGQVEAKHQQKLEQLEAMKSKHASMTKEYSKAKAYVSQRQAQLDSLLQHLHFTQGVSEDLRLNVKTLNKARHKAGAEKAQAEDQRFKQDLYVAQLTKELERLTEQIAMYEAQTNAQAEETREVKEILSEAEMELELLLMVRKQLLQQWNSSLMGMRRRNDAFNAVQEGVREGKHQLILLDKEIDSYKKSLTAEQDQDETLTVQLNWFQMDGATYKKLICEKQAQQEALQAQYSTCLRTLQQTEQTLATLSKEFSSHQTEVNEQRKQLEKESSVRLELENNIMTSMQNKLLHNRAAKYSQRLTDKIATVKREKMSQLRQTENEVLLVRLESQQVDQQVDSLALIQEGLDEEIANHNKLLTDSEAKVASFVRLIEQKQNTIINYNNKISQIAARTGDERLGPLHMKIQVTMDQIEELATNIKSDQHLWMKQQGILVGLTQEMEANHREMLKLQIQHTGLQQKKIHLESQIQLEHRKDAEVEKNATMLKHDLLKLNMLLNKKGHLSHALEEENAMMETDFRNRLKDAEREYIRMQMKHEKMQEEKERLLKSLVEAEWQIMLWEKKIQLAKETRVAMDVDQGEIQMMKAEIHCMEVRLSQLMRQQEQLQRESEASVVRRETIVLRREVMMQNPRKQVAKSELRLQIQGLQRKIQETHKQVANCEQVIRELQKSQECLSNSLRQRNTQLTEMRSTIYSLKSEFVNLQDTKELNLAHLVALQSQTKRLQAVCEGSYKAASTSESVDAALQSQMEHIHSVSIILHRVCEECPQHQGALRRLSRALATQT